MTPDNTATDQIAPSQAEAGPSTAPTLTAADEVSQLRAEIARLRALVDAGGNDPHLLDEEADVGATPDAAGGVAPVEAGEKLRIPYGDQPFSGARLMGLTKDRDRIRRTDELPELPTPTTDRAQLEDDFMRWGYCLVADALTPEQVATTAGRLVDQADAERAAGVAHLSHRGAAQFVPNLLPKGQVFRDLITFEEHATVRGPLIEELLGKILGKGFYLGTTHGSVVHEHGGRQELHQDQGYVALPHPPYPLACLIIWCLTDFGLEEGGTYVVPGSHRDPDGRNHVRPGVEFEKVAEERLLALSCPAGTCTLTDSRLLHSGGKRTAPGTRLALRNLYVRGHMRQQENQFVAVSDEVVAQASPKLRAMMGYAPYQSLGMVDGNTMDPARPQVHMGELSMSRPEEFERDFSWRFTLDAKHAAQNEWNTGVQYRGD